MKKVDTKSGLMLGVLLLLCNALKAQFTLSGQVRTRSEYRDGTGTLLDLTKHSQTRIGHQSDQV